MESRGKRDRLEMVCGIADFAARRVGIGSGNGSSILDAGRWIDCLGKMYTGIEIRIGRIAAVAGPEAGVYIELREVREPGLAGRSRGLTAGQRPEPQAFEEVQFRRRSAFRSKESLDESGMADLVIRIIVYILSHVRIKDRYRIGVESVTTGCGREFVILGSAELPILYPQIAFDDF